MIIQKVICNKCGNEIIGQKEISDSWVSNRYIPQDNLCDTCRREYEFEMGLLQIKIKELNEKLQIKIKELNEKYLNNKNQE